VTIEELEADVAEDGTVAPYDEVETRYARVEAIAAAMTAGGRPYLSVIADYQDCFIETRVEPELLARVGITASAEAALMAKLAGAVRRLMAAIDEAIGPVTDANKGDGKVLGAFEAMCYGEDSLKAFADYCDGPGAAGATPT
jgi:hypothetical protein